MVDARILVRRSGAAVGSLGLVAAGFVGASPAAAATSFPTWGTSVNVRADAFLDAPVVGQISAPTTVSVECQAQGSHVTVGGASSDWWAYLPDYGGFMTVVYIDVPESRLPGVPVCDGDDVPEPTDVTLADLQAMFPGKVGDATTVSEGLPSLNQAMRDANITTPQRKAAFLTTIAHESTFLYNIREIGDTRPYGGRGYIQLTGDFNYEAAGSYFGIDLLGDPELARSLQWSAAISRWYWTVARDINPMADRLDMGAVNAAIGYPPGPHDQVRCAAFANALEYFLGHVPGGINCNRPSAASTLNVPADQAKGLGVGDVVSDDR